MKRFRILAAVALFVVAALLAGCMVTSTNISIDAEEVSSIDIYYLIDHYYGWDSFVEHYEPFCTLEVEKHSDFLAELAEIEYSDSVPLLPIPSDPSFVFDEWTVCVRFRDGSFRIISCDGYGETRDKDGEVVDSDHYGCDNDEWHAFIDSYIPDGMSVD